jgi:hypothetical protein
MEVTMVRPFSSRLVSLLLVIMIITFTYGIIISFHFLIKEQQKKEREEKILNFHRIWQYQILYCVAPDGTKKFTNIVGDISNFIPLDKGQRAIVTHDSTGRCVDTYLRREIK